jgi:CspA family cold shock protein
MTLGTVRWFDAPKGYGFIKPDDGGADVLVSICALERAEMTGVTKGQQIQFDMVYDKRIGRLCAERLTTFKLHPGHEVI